MALACSRKHSKQDLRKFILSCKRIPYVGDPLVTSVKKPLRNESPRCSPVMSLMLRTSHIRAEWDCVLKPLSPLETELERCRSRYGLPQLLRTIVPPHNRRQLKPSQLLETSTYRTRKGALTELPSCMIACRLTLQPHGNREKVEQQDGTWKQNCIEHDWSS